MGYTFDYTPDIELSRIILFAVSGEFLLPLMTFIGVLFFVFLFYNWIIFLLSLFCFWWWPLLKKDISKKFEVSFGRRLELRIKSLAFIGVFVIDDNGNIEKGKKYKYFQELYTDFQREEKIAIKSAQTAASLSMSFMLAFLLYQGEYDVTWCKTISIIATVYTSLNLIATLMIYRHEDDYFFDLLMLRSKNLNDLKYRADYDLIIQVLKMGKTHKQVENVVGLPSGYLKQQGHNEPNRD